MPLEYAALSKDRHSRAVDSRVIHEEEKPEAAEEHAVGRGPHHRHAEAQVPQPVDAHESVRPGTGTRACGGEKKRGERNNIINVSTGE